MGWSRTRCCGSIEAVNGYGRRCRAAARADGSSSATSPITGMATTTGHIATAAKKAIPSGDGATAMDVMNQPWTAASAACEVSASHHMRRRDGASPKSWSW